MKPLTEAEGLSLIPRWCAIALAPVALGYVVAVLALFVRKVDLIVPAILTILALPILMPFYLAALAHQICRMSGIVGWQTRVNLVLALGALAAVAWIPLFLLLIVFVAAIGPGDAAALGVPTKSNVEHFVGSGLLLCFRVGAA